MSKSSISRSYQLCVAPMMDWTDRHCRYFHRQLSPSARLYTEMVTTGALLHGDVPRHLDFDAAEHPVALQLGGSEPDALARSAKLGERWGYDEINLNCGCPSERVQNGAFGACLMAEPHLVADGVRAMRDAVAIPVTVKHRIGLDRNDDYGFVRDFVGIVGDAGCDVFIVHARNAWLKGLSPKENREVPPLRHDVVTRLKHDFPDATFVVNGGLAVPHDIGDALERFDGVMLGRAAYHEPWLLAMLDPAGRGATSRAAVVASMKRYAAQCAADGVPLRSIVRHMLGLYHGRPAARTWRRLLSDSTLLRGADATLLDQALAAVEHPAVAPATSARLDIDSFRTKERDAAERDESERDVIERHAVGRDDAGRHVTEQGAAGRDAAGYDVSERDAAGRPATGRKAPGPHVRPRDASQGNAKGPDAVPSPSGQADATDRSTTPALLRG